MTNLSFHLSTPIVEDRLYLRIEIAKEDSKKLDPEANTFWDREKKETMRLLKSSNSSPDLLVRKEMAKQAILLFARKGKLFFEKKSLIVDPFTPFQWQFEATYVEKGLEVEGKLFFLKKESPIKKSDVFFSSHEPWIIQDGVWRWLDSTSDFRWIGECFGKKLLIQEDKKESFIRDCEEEVLWRNEQRFSLVPYLKLTDRNGMFADLWMAYNEKYNIAYHDPKTFSFRDKEKEKAWEKDLLETDFYSKNMGTSHYHCPMDKVAKSLTFLMEIGWRVFDVQNREVLLQKKNVDIVLQEDKKELLVRGKVSYDNYAANISDVVGSFNKRERFVLLSDSAVGLIDPAPLSNIIELEATLKEDALCVDRRSFGVFSDFGSETKENVSYIENILSRFTTYKESPPTDGFLGKLYPYQQEGVNWLMHLYSLGFHGLLADDMGLGKTVQLLAFLSQIQTKEPILIVVPTSLIFHWKLEIEKFLPKERVYIHAGSSRKEELSFEQKTIVLTSYVYLRMDYSLLKEIPFECVILDEAQVIKNPDSQTAKAAFSLKANFRLAVTGTPVENAWLDLWSLFHFLMPGLLEERKMFLSKMQTVNEHYVRKIKRKLLPFIKRREKSALGDQLPDKQEQTVFVEMTDKQRALYEEYLVKNQKGLLQKVKQDGVSSHRMEILEAILRLRQICCHPFLVDAAHSTDDDISGKYNTIFDDLETVVQEKRKVLIYSQFTQMLQFLLKKVKELGWKYTYLDGSTKDREEMVRQFQEDPDTLLFFISLKAGGVGLNLNAADYVFLFDPWWNEAVERQAMDRAHRIGRKGTVFVRRYVTVMSIEEKIMRLKEYKKGLSDSLFSDEMEIQNLSLEDWCELLEG